MFSSKGNEMKKAEIILTNFYRSRDFFVYTHRQTHGPTAETEDLGFEASKRVLALKSDHRKF